MRVFKQLSLDECDEIFATIRVATTAEQLAPLYDKLLAEQPLLEYAYTRGSFFWRGRRCNGENGWPNGLDLLYPPSQSARADRLNDAGDPLLYASTGRLTALAELKVVPGEYIHLIAIRIKQGAGIRFLTVGEFNHVFEGGFSRLVAGEPARVLKRILNDMGTEMGMRIIYVDAFLSGLLADPIAAEKGYLHTRALRHAIFRKNPNAEGFFYPSVRDTLGMNLAIKPRAFDLKGQLVASQVIHVTRKREFSFYDYDYCRHAKWCEDDGRFAWLPPEEPHEFVVFGMTDEEEKFCRERNDIVTGNAIEGFMESSRGNEEPNF